MSDKRLAEAIAEDVPDLSKGGGVDVLSIPVRPGETVPHKKERAIAKIKSYFENLDAEAAGRAKMKDSGLGIFVAAKSAEDCGLVGLAISMLGSVGAILPTKEEYRGMLEPWMVMDGYKGATSADRERVLMKQIQAVEREIKIMEKRQGDLEEEKASRESGDVEMMECDGV